MSRLEDKNNIEKVIKVLRNSGEEPSIPTSDYKSDGTWVNTDIYEGQIAINISDDRIWYRSDDEIIELTSGECKTIKIHRTTPHTGVTTDNWTDCDNFTLFTGETNSDCFTFSGDNKTIIINEDGFYNFGGCVHFRDNSGGGFNNLTVLSRLYRNGTDELRCSQRGKEIELRAGGEEVLSYNGTAYFEEDDYVRLQYFTNETNLEFDSNSNFDSQVAYTLWITKCGL